MLLFGYILLLQNKKLNGACYEGMDESLCSFNYRGFNSV